MIGALEQATRQQVTLVAAPAGYGKTTAVAQWLADGDRPPTAWVSLDSNDNDPVRLLTHLAAALTRVGCVVPVSEAPRVAGATASDGQTGILSAIVTALGALSDDLVLVLDDLHFIQEPTCHQQVQFLIANLPAQAHLVIITRADPGLRLGRLRASGDLAEIRADHLIFTTEETTELLAHEDVRLSDEAVKRLVERTEGWPAGLYLATLSMSGRSDPDEFVERFSGGNRFIGDYLTEEVLNQHADDVREFILSASILDRFSAPLCDHVAGIGDSARILHELELANLFLVPLDEEHVWFRFHHLFAAVARSELEVTRREAVKPLHARAAEWFRSEGLIDEAVRHFLAAADTDAAAMLIQKHWLRYVDAGNAVTVKAWLESLGAAALASSPPVRVTSAWMAAISGAESDVADELAALSALEDLGPLPDGTRSVESAVAMIQGLFGYGGPVEMMTGAQRAVALETDIGSPFFAVANVALGHASYVAGDLDGALTSLRRASHSDQAPGTIRVAGLSIESLVEGERGDKARSRECAESALGIVEAEGLRAVTQASLVSTAVGQAQADAGKVEDGLATLELGLAARRETSSFGPWGMIHHLLVTGRVAAQAGQLPLAQELVTELATRMGQFSDGMGPMRARLNALQRLIAAEAGTARPAEQPLTARELEVLRLLQRGLSHHDIARELYLSDNTVKTHLRAVYRKLGAHSRPEALRIAHRQMLL